MSPSGNLDFFKELKEWSGRKLNLIRKYLDSATRILGSIDQVYYIDGFAGRGSYGDPSEPQVLGSPLQAAQLAQEYASGQKSYLLQCINVEADRETYEELDKATAAYSSVTLNIHGTFADSVQRILTAIGTKPAICFLDPFGVDGMDWSAIQKLICRSGQTDLWLRFDVTEVRRLDGSYDSDGLGADKKFDVLTKAYGINDRDRLHQEFMKGNTAEDRKQQAVNLYLEQLRREIKSAKREGYAEAYRIGSLEEETKYYLVFATASKKGIILASNIVYGIEEDYQRELERYKASTNAQMNMFSQIDPTEEEIFQAKVNDLVDTMTRLCCGKTLTRQEIHTMALSTRFGIIKGTHMTQALKQLIDKGVARSNTNAISNDYTQFSFRQC